MEAVVAPASEYALEEQDGSVAERTRAVESKVVVREEAALGEAASRALVVRAVRVV